MKIINEYDLENAALDWFKGLGYAVKTGSELSESGERDSYEEVVLVDRLKAAIARLNPRVSADAQEQALKKVLRTHSPNLVLNNRAFHRMLYEGVPVEYKAKTGGTRGDLARLFDFEDFGNNDWLVVSQFEVIENKQKRRPDLVVFVNGIPLAVIELKNPAEQQATVWSAFDQLQNYKSQISSLFAYNELLVISDGLTARLGSLTSDRVWFMGWRTIAGEIINLKTTSELEALVKGVFAKNILLDYARNFAVFEDDGKKISKKLAGYHQYYAVKGAIESTVKASGPRGDKRCGVVWHTQGSGKSLTMIFYAAKVIGHPAMNNPTLVLLTDRNDLDDQLFGRFCDCHEILRQDPVQARNRSHLQKLLKVASGGVVFTTIQKFFPEKNIDKMPLLSDRRNIIVIADEAHRSQYDFIDGFAKHIRDALPNASFIGFTGTPIELKDKNTRAVFGDYISVYDIQQAVLDRATVPIYYEGRLAKIELKEEERPKIDPEFEEVTEGQELEKKEKLKSRWARLESLVGTDKRVELAASDIVDHWEKRLSVMRGKAMIVCMSRRICAKMYQEIVKLRPDWHGDDDRKGKIKVVITGSAADKPELLPHVRKKSAREALARRFKDEDDGFKVVIVRDMWLTGFDVPCLHTMYVDKPMRGHTLMQAIARVNRVFRDKPGGLVVDYLGLAYQLKEAMAAYTDANGKGEMKLDQDRAIELMQEQYEICRAMFFGFDYSGFKAANTGQQVVITRNAAEHVLKQENGRARFAEAVSALLKAFALSVPSDEAMAIRDEVEFFQTVRAALAKSRTGVARPEDDLDFAICQIVSKAVSTEKVIDIFTMAGLDKPNISILSDEFLEEVRAMPQKNLAVEVLRKLLNGEIKLSEKKNLVQSRSFAEMLERTILGYQNRTMETAAVIAELINLAKDMRESGKRGEKLGLREDEVAFYDALGVNDSAVKIMGDQVLKKIAQELVDTVRRNATIDWTVKESARAKLRTMVRRTLRKYNYPPDKEEKATQTVIEQAELLGLEAVA